MLAGGREAEHPEPEETAQLRHGEADAPRCGVHQHRFTTPRRGDTHQHVVGGEVDDGEGRALLERPVGGEAEHRRGGDDNELALASEPRRGHDPFADWRSRDAGADGLDDARDLVTDRAWWFWGVGVEALTGE